nr:L,D-transpeptidase [Phaeovulum vinaykumarii]
MPVSAPRVRGPRLFGGGGPLRAVLGMGALALVLAGCAPAGPGMAPGIVPPEYAAREDGDRTVPAVNPKYLVERNRRRWVNYDGPEPAGTVVVDPYARVLYHIVEPGKAMRFGIAVGREGRGFRGRAVIRRKEEYPYWAPTRNMIRQDPALYGPVAAGLPGGLDNPLGARALYLYRGGKDSYYRIHGTMDPTSIGKATSAGCIRLFNQDIIDMYDEVPLGTPVKVRTRAESLEMEGEMVELSTGYLVPASDTRAIEADRAAVEAAARAAREAEPEGTAAP